jgi:hypothetical protein
MDWKSDSNSRAPVLQAQSLVHKAQANQKIKYLKTKNTCL